MLGVIGRAPPLARPLLQVYSQDLGPTAANLFFGGPCVVADVQANNVAAASSTRAIAPWVSNGLNTTGNLASSNTIISGGGFNELPPVFMSAQNLNIQNSQYANGLYWALASTTNATAYQVGGDMLYDP